MITSESEFLNCALNNYNNPQLNFVQEFEEDLLRFRSLNVLSSRYRENDTINYKLIVNHLIILENCFTLSILLRLLDYKIQKENKYVIDTFLFFMEKIDKVVDGVDFKLLKLLNEE